VNSIVGPSFKENFTEIRTCGPCERCTGPTQKTQLPTQAQTHCYLN